MRHGHFAADRSDIYNAAATVSLHVRNNFLHEIERTPEMHAHGAFEILEVHILDRPDLNRARVVDQDVDSACFTEDRRYAVTHLALIAYVTDQGQNLGAAAPEFVRRVHQLIWVARQKHEIGALIRKSAGQFQAQPARRTGDENGFAGEIHAASLARRINRRGAKRTDQCELGHWAQARL